MSLITEEERQEFEDKSTEDLIKIVKERKPRRSDKTVDSLVKTSRHALSKDYFWTLADLGKSMDEKASELGKTRGTIGGYRTLLLALGVIKPYSKKLYTADGLTEVEQRFHDVNLVREAVNRHTKMGEEFTIGQIADRLDMAKIEASDSVKRYGVEYKAYQKLEALLSLETRRGNLEKRKKGGSVHYTRVNELTPIKRSYLIADLYTKADLIEADRRFPNRDALREEINQHAIWGEKFSAAELADRLGIPRVWPKMAIKQYGTDYSAYQKLVVLLHSEAGGGNPEKGTEHGRTVFTLVDPLMPVHRYRWRKKKKGKTEVKRKGRMIKQVTIELEDSYDREKGLESDTNNRVTKLLDYLKRTTGTSGEIEIEGENMETGEEIPIKVKCDDYSAIGEFCKKYDVYGMVVTLGNGDKIDFIYDDKGKWEPFRVVDAQGVIYMGKHARRQFPTIKIYQNPKTHLA